MTAGLEESKHLSMIGRSVKECADGLPRDLIEQHSTGFRVILVLLNSDAIRSIAKIAKDDGFPPAFLRMQSTCVSSSFGEPDIKIHGRTRLVFVHSSLDLSEVRQISRSM